MPLPRALVALAGSALLVAASVVGAAVTVEPAAAASPGPVAPPGYWLVASDGGIFTFSSPYDGSTGAMVLNQPIVGMAPTIDTGGYWLVASDGGIFSFGDAKFYGSTGNLVLNRPIVGMAATPTGRGYWLVASDGGIFSFGDAKFYGSTGNLVLNRPIVGMAATPTGHGYRLVASDGGIFSFGDAKFYGSTGNLVLNRPVVGMASTATGLGYWLVASDGGIFAFGDAKFAGSTGNIVLNQPVVGMAAAPSGGYWLVASDGGMFAFGGAPFLGSMGGHPLNRPIVGMAVNPIGDPYPSGTTGYDISWPQCGPPVHLPPPPYRVTIVGVNGGQPFLTNPCFHQEVAWAGPSLTLYANTGPFTLGDPKALNGPAGACAAGDVMCQAYNWGWNAANYDVDAAAAAGVTESTWWLDVETKNGWCEANCDPMNDRNIQGMIDGLRSRGASPGIYGTGYQFGLIAGDSYQPRVPLWVAGASSEAQAPSFCGPAYWFAGGQAWLVQFPPNPFDGDYAC
jgi:hypothetical protein